MEAAKAKYVTMRTRYVALTDATPLTDEHRIDYAHLESCWQSDPAVLSAWEMRYLHELEPRLSKEERAAALVRWGEPEPWVELPPAIERPPPGCPRAQ